MERWFVTANHIEAGFWVLIGLIFLFAAVRARKPARTSCVIVAAAFFLFGMSDLVEARTGAWWWPWWLLVWKGICLMVFAYYLVLHLRRRSPRQ